MPPQGSQPEPSAAPSAPPSAPPLPPPPPPDDKDVIHRLPTYGELTRSINVVKILERKANITFGIAIGLLLTGAVLIVWNAVESTSVREMRVTKAAVGFLLDVVGGVVLKLHNDAIRDLKELAERREQLDAILLIRDQTVRESSNSGPCTKAATKSVSREQKA